MVKVSHNTKPCKATGVKCVDADVFISAYADHLMTNGEIEIPSWAPDVKTGKRKQMPPQDPDWLYTRIAAVARQLYLRPKGVGVGTLARYFGGRTRNHVTKKHFSRASRKNIRFAINELVKLGFVDVVENEIEDEKTEIRKKLSRAGQKSMDAVANECENCSGFVQDISFYTTEEIDLEDHDPEAESDAMEEDEDFDDENVEQ